LKSFANVCRTSNNLDKVLAQVDIIHVCTPNATHYDVSKKALSRNVNVLVEKPMSSNVEQAFDLVELSMKKGSILQVGHIFRFANVVRKIKQMFERGDFGDEYYFNLEWTHLIAPIKNVDVTRDLLPHPLDIINFITGKWPHTFIGVGRAFRRSSLIEVASIEAIYDHFFGNIILSWLTPTRKRKLEIIGSKKCVTADCVKQTARIYDGNSSQELSVDQNNTVRDEILNFINSVKTGKSDFNSSIIGARTIQMVDEASRSIRVLNAT
jgi:predicted dehydrogenase